ncbi:outer membrane beta-barrel protein [Xanthocytophaga agilis]|uniref:Outer membrane beta-barrel protein n=1 Tax=Xanthocytophaga agilis TaxID=3048010 RepID=A0AAE3QZV9_9BACT|nr:outer membrane beta-barrel protein [Xanthocytophaga agilis]MDJ1501134.1 outer membrane beta-barrel protein [Xanthocytophaga agilis]
MNNSTMLSLRSIPIILFIIFSIHIQAQSLFNPGKIVTSKGDTVSVLIKDRPDKLNSSECIVKTSSGEKAIVYTPVDIRAYILESGKIYVSRTIGNAESKDSIHVFLQKLVGGEINLYFWRGSQGKDRYFAEVLPDGMLELEGQKDTYINGQRYQADGKYQKQLNSIMTKCVIDQGALAELRYIRTDMTKFVVKYNKCSEIRNQTYQYQEPKGKHFWGVRIGTNIGNVNLVAGDAAIKGVPLSPMPMVSVFGSFQLVDMDRRLYLQPELQFVMMKIENFTQAKPKVDIGEIRNNLIYIPVTVKYDLLRGAITPYVYAGAGVSLNFSSEMKINYMYRRLNEESLNRKLGAQVILGAGLKWKRPHREYALDYRMYETSLHATNSTYDVYLYSNNLTFSVALEKKRK